MDLILEYKWFFFIAAEIVFWLSLIAFLVLRYWFRLEQLSLFVVIVFLLNDLWIALLAFFDYRATGEFSIFQIIIVVFIVYALTFGKSDFKKLDFFVKKQVAKWRGESLAGIESPVQYYGMTYALHEWKGFAGHMFIFGLLHFLFFMAFGLSDSFGGDWLSSWSSKETSTVPFKNEDINKLSQVWLLILAIDFVITLSYTIFPKKRPVE